MERDVLSKSCVLRNRVIFVNLAGGRGLGPLYPKITEDTKVKLQGF